MLKVEKVGKTIKRIGDTSLISEEELYKYLHKSMRLRSKMNKEINLNYLKQHTIQRELIYHPFWIAKVLVIAERSPFPSKKTPNVIFVDAISGYRGLFSKIPPIKDEIVDRNQSVKMVIAEEKEAMKYVKHVQEKQINRSYVLKKPIHEVKEILPVYLPLWKVEIKSELVDDTFFINGNTGESEKYLSERWEGKDLLS